MTPTLLHTHEPTVQAVPLALIFTSRVLLAEKSLVPGNPRLMAGELETFTLRASNVTEILKGIHGYDYYQNTD